MVDKTVKLWRVYEKTVKAVAEGSLTGSGADFNAAAPATQPMLRLPKLTVSDSFIAAQPKKIYANAHTYHINSVSVNSDGETFLSADDLRVNLWNFNTTDQSFSTLTPPTNLCIRNGGRHCGHQAGEYGGAHGSYNGGGVSPAALQFVHV